LEHRLWLVIVLALALCVVFVFAVAAATATAAETVGFFWGVVECQVTFISASFSILGATSVFLYF